MVSTNVIETDVLVIGGGMAGIFAAIKAREQGRDVVLIDKGYISKSGATAFAGGYFVAFNEERGHNVVDWVNQVSKTGEYMVNREWSRIILKDSYARYQDLVSWGVEFIKEGDKLHVNRRGVLESINMWRRRYHPVLRNQALKTGVRLIDRVMITELLKQDGRIVGAVGFHTISGHFFTFKAKATVISAGAGCFKPAGLPVSYLTGDGEAMAFRAGAEITGKEFPDKHYTMSNFPAWRGHGMTMARFHKFIDAEGQELDPSSLVFGMDFAAHSGRAPVLWNLDEAGPDDIKSMLQHQKITVTTIEAERVGLDVSRGGKVPMVSGAYTGASVHQAEGIWVIDATCATTLPGLYAAGDACGTRQIGAVYPATGFGLGASAVTGARAGLSAAEYTSQIKKITVGEGELDRLREAVYEPMKRTGGFSVGWVTQQLQNIMMPYHILQIKHGERLQAALVMVEFIRDHLIPKITAKDAHELRLAHETRSMVLNAEMILRTSIFRTESRGTHYREDYPRRDDPTWLVWVKVKEDNGEMKLLKEPIPKDWWPDLSKPYEERYPMRFPGE